LNDLGPIDSGALAGCEARLGHRFGDRRLLTLALTHRSFANEQIDSGHNERLEFLGDAVLGLVAADWLFRRYPERAEGELALAKAALVSERSLILFAEEIELGGVIRLGALEARTGGGGKGTLLADALEALFGAIFLDGGWSAAAGAVGRFLEWVEPHAASERKDPKTELQERIQAAGRPLPVYAIVTEEGPEHDKRFTCEVTLEGEAAGLGVGRTKKEAQQQAAAAALAQMDFAGDGEPPAG
jgi:ribonuclease-3